MPATRHGLALPRARARPSACSSARSSSVAVALAAMTLAFVCAPVALAAPETHAPVVFAPAWDALVGQWQGVVPPPPSHDRDLPPVARAAVTFAYELDGRILTRRRVTELAASNGRPPARHEELMTIYPAPDGRNAEAMYFDSEGHVIHYAGTWSSDERSLVLVSFPAEGEPRMKLTWHFDDIDVLSQTVEVAPPGSVSFRRFDGGVLRRVPVIGDGSR